MASFVSASSSDVVLHFVSGSHNCVLCVTVLEVQMGPEETVVFPTTRLSVVVQGAILLGTW